MLSEGSRDMTARQIAERLDFHGSYFEVNVDRDYVYISFSSLSKFFGPTLEVAEQILLQPLFPEDELRAYCEKRKQTLTIERRKVDTVVREEPHVTFRPFLNRIYPPVAQTILYADVVICLSGSQKG